MKIGIFDSGVGGLLLMHAIVSHLPRYDYVYLGDTKRVPYGGRSQETIYDFTREAVDFLFARDCKLIIIACNTASAQALRRIQQEYLPAHYPDRRVLGVIIPTIEAVASEPTYKKIGVIATQSTVNSNVFAIEMKKQRPDIEVVQNAAPLLVPLIEQGGLKYAGPILSDYLAPLIAANVDAVILGCTHYPMVKAQVQDIVGDKVKVIAQGDIVPQKLAEYLSRHPEIDEQLSKNAGRELFVTDETVQVRTLAQQWFGVETKLNTVKID